MVPLMTIEALGCVVGVAAGLMWGGGGIHCRCVPETA
jgi:hypothetical protein